MRTVLSAVIISTNGYAGMVKNKSEFGSPVKMARLITDGYDGEATRQFDGKSVALCWQRIGYAYLLSS